MIENILPQHARKPLKLAEIGSRTLDGHILTLSGRKIDYPPEIRTSSNQILRRDIIRIAEWLIREAGQEALFREDDFNIFQFKHMDPKKLHQIDYDIANEYLFGVTDIIYLHYKG